MRIPLLKQTSAVPEATIFGVPRWAMLVASLVAIGSLIGDIGFVLPAWAEVTLDVVDVALAAFFVSDLALALLRAKHWRQAFYQRWYEYVLVVLFVGALAVMYRASQVDQIDGILSVLQVKSATKLLIALTQLFILGSISLRLLRAQRRMLSLGVRPEYILVGSFLVLIVVGWLVLMLPRMSEARSPPLGAIDALFTATSASCVTGLVVRDTGTAFSGTGQFVIMVLFQIGGMGIVTFVALVTVASGRGLSVPQLVLLRDLVSAKAISDVRRSVLGIVFIALGIEALGSVCLFYSLPPAMGVVERWEWSIFHSISAFCNAGFGLKADSLTQYQVNWGVNLTCMGLIIIGGLGFPVILDLLGYRLSGLKRYRRWRFMRARRQELHQRSARLSLQTKLSLVTMAILIVGGTLGFAALEWTKILNEFGVGDSLLISLFQAVTPRTAGFNTVPLDQLQDSTQIFIMVLMVIGAGPVSTGGGIKTVAFAVLFLTIRSMITGRNQVEVFGRTLPRKVVHGAISVSAIYMVSAVLVTFGLAITDPAMSLQAQVFETISALSTVGLSTGITAELSSGGKLLIILAMFIGRVGPLTLFLSVFKSSGGNQLYQYPEEEIVVS